MKLENSVWPEVMSSDRRFEVSTVGVGSGKVQLIVRHKRSQISVEAQVEMSELATSAGRPPEQLCAELVSKILKCNITEPGEDLVPRLLRCEYANLLIDIISSYGTGLFYSRSRDEVARFSYSNGVHLHDQSGAVISLSTLSSQGGWLGFSYGGMLRDFVLQIRNYIMRGDKIDPAYLGIEHAKGLINAWGYPPEQLRSCKKAAMQLPVIRRRQERAA